MSENTHRCQLECDSAAERHTICSRLMTGFILSLDKSVAVSHMQSASVRKKSPSISFGDSCPAVLYYVFTCWLQHTCASARFFECVCVFFIFFLLSHKPDIISCHQGQRLLSNFTCADCQRRCFSADWFPGLTLSYALPSM